MGFETSRLAEVSDGEGRSLGTGYLVGANLLLTAGHVVDTQPDGVSMIRFLDEDTWRRCRVVWRGDESRDAALLDFVDSGSQRLIPAKPIRWGTLMGSRPVACTVTGFPAFARDQGQRRDVEQLIGQINPVSGFTSSRWVIESSGIDLASSAGSPLAGMSGAPVFAGELLIGILSMHNRARLLASRVDRLLDSPEAADLILARVGIPFLAECAELADVLKPPLPQRRVTSLGMLISSDVEAVPFHGRHEELAQLTEWCKGEGARAYVLVAPGGYGKTRLAMQFAAYMARRGWAAGTLGANIEPGRLDEISRVEAPTLLVIDYGETQLEQVRRVVNQALLRPPTGPVRILILARSIQGWWDSLGNGASSSEEAEIFKTAVITQLKPLEDTAEGRLREFQEAASGFAAFMPQFPGLEDQDWEGTARTISPPDLDRPEYAAILRVHVAALTALLSSNPGTVGLLEAIRDFEIRHERYYSAAQAVRAPEHVTTPDSTGIDEQQIMPPDGESAEAGSIHTRGFGDRPSNSDLLGRTALIAAVADLLAPSQQAIGIDEDRPDVGGPTVVALEGPWGSGKTTMMQLIERELARRQRPPRTDHPKRRHPWPQGPSESLSAVGAYRVMRMQDREKVTRPSDRAQPQHGGPTETPSSTMTDRATAATPLLTVITAHFNPWAHQSSEQIWAGLTRSIVEAAQPTLGSDGREREKYWLHRNCLRLDRRHLRRAFWRHLSSPLLAVAVFALLAPLVAQLVKGGQTYTFGGQRLSAPVLALVIPAALLALGILHTAGRFLLGRARSFLPGEIFDGPVLSGTLASGAGGSGDPSLRDPYYNARSGYLYLVQHDIRELLAGLKAKGYELIVFIDDLDRCSPAATADVFEAINLFLSGALYGSMASEEVSQSLPRCRFVIGLDPAVVAAHLDRAYQDLATSKAFQADEDPSWGWTFLRKLIQLPVTLPPIMADSVRMALTGLLGAVTQSPQADQNASDEPEILNTVDGTRTRAPISPPTVQESPALIQYEPETEAQARALETHPMIRDRIQERLCARSDVSIRETKRLLTIWQFYLRVIGHKERGSDHLSVEQAMHLVILAEITARWPAMQSQLRRPVDGIPGLLHLARNVGDDVSWAKARIRISLDGAQHAKACEGLRTILQDYEGETVAIAIGKL